MGNEWRAAHTGLGRLLLRLRGARQQRDQGKDEGVGGQGPEGGEAPLVLAREAHQGMQGEIGVGDARLMEQGHQQGVGPDQRPHHQPGDKALAIGARPVEQPDNAGQELSHGHEGD